MSRFSRTEGEEIVVPSDGPPTGDEPCPKVFEEMGMDNIFLMLQDFYKELDTSSIREMFEGDLVAASQKSAMFFTFLLGGPPLYHEKIGPPMMRKRHFPFKISEGDRLIWIACFHRILKDAPSRYSFPEEQIEPFKKFLERFSKWMVNHKV